MYFSSIFLTIFCVILPTQSQQTNSNDRRQYVAPEESRNQNQWNYNTQRGNGTRSQQVSSNQTGAYMSETVQQDLYRENRPLETPNSGRSRVWNRQEQTGNEQIGPGNNQNWNGQQWDQDQNRLSQHQNWDRIPEQHQTNNQNQDYRRQDYYQTWGAQRQPQNHHSAPPNGNQYDQQQYSQHSAPPNRNQYDPVPQNHNYGRASKYVNNPQHNQIYNQQPPTSHINTVGFPALNAGIIPFIDPDLPDGLDDLWEMNQKQSAMQHLMQTNPGLITQAMMPRPNYQGPQGPNHSGPSNDKAAGGPGRVRVWTKPENSQNMNMSGSDQEYRSSVPHRSNFESPPVQKENRVAHGNMLIHPSTFADASNKAIQHNMPSEEKTHLSGTQKVNNLQEYPGNISQQQPTIQRTSASETKTTNLKIEDNSGNLQTADRGQLYRKRGQNRNNGRNEPTTPEPYHNQKPTTGVWNVKHQPTTFEYEQNPNTMYRSRQHEPSNNMEVQQQKGQTDRINQPYYGHTDRNIQQSNGRTDRDNQQNYGQMNKDNQQYYEPTVRNNQQMYSEYVPPNKSQYVPLNKQKYEAGTESHTNFYPSPSSQREQRNSAWDPRQTPHFAEYVHEETQQWNRKGNTVTESENRGYPQRPEQDTTERTGQTSRYGNNPERGIRNYQSERNPPISQYSTRSGQRPEHFEQEHEGEREHENIPRSSYSYRDGENENRLRSSYQGPTEYRPNIGNQRLHDVTLQDVIDERIKQRRIDQDRNNSMPWDNIQEGGTQSQPPHQVKNNAMSWDHIPEGGAQSKPLPQKGNNGIPWDNIQEGGSPHQQSQPRHDPYNEHITSSHYEQGPSQNGFYNKRISQNEPYGQSSTRKNTDPRIAPNLPNEPYSMEKGHLKDTSTVNKTVIPAITGREVWRDPANQQEIQASKLSPSVLDKIIDSFVYEGVDEIDTPYGKIEKEESGGYEIDGQLLRMILSEIENEQRQRNRTSPKQLEHQRKFAGFDTSVKSTAGSDKVNKPPLQRETAQSKQEVTTKSTHDRQRAIWDSLPTFDHPNTQIPTYQTPKGSPSNTGRQVWNKQEPWDTVTTANNRNVWDHSASPWEPVAEQQPRNPLFESKISSNRRNSSRTVKQPSAVAQIPEFPQNNIDSNHSSVAIVTKPIATTTPPTTGTPVHLLPPEVPSGTLWKHVLFDEPFNLNKTPPETARMIMIPDDEMVVLNQTLTNDIKKRIVKSETSDSAFSILIALVIGAVVIVAPIVCLVWRVRKHYREKKSKKLQADKTVDTKCVMEAMISDDLGRCDEISDQGARKKTYFTTCNSKMQDLIRELQPLNSGRISPTVIVHQENEIY